MFRSLYRATGFDSRQQSSNNGDTMTHEKRQKICSLMGDVYESAQAISRLAIESIKESHKISEEKLAKSHKAIAELARIMGEEIAEIKNELGTT